MTTERNAQGVGVLAAWDSQIARLKSRRDDQAAFVNGTSEWFEPPKGDGARDLLARYEAALADAVSAREAMALLASEAKAVLDHVEDENAERVGGQCTLCNTYRSRLRAALLPFQSEAES